MEHVDLNMLIALDALLAERSVTGAARRLGLSVSAMSRTLARLRAATGDSLLLQAGRVLVLTPYAEQLSLRIPNLAQEALAALSPSHHSFNIATLKQCFTIRAGEGFIDLLASFLLARINRAAPYVQIRFVPKQDWDAQPLREGAIDLEIGTVRTSAPELRTHKLFRDRYVGVCRRGHPILDRAQISVEDYVAFEHVLTSRAGERDHPVDAALEARGLQRQVRIVVPAYTAAMQVVRSSDLLAVIPYSCLGNLFTPDHAVAQGLAHFELPVSLLPFNISSIWHPRLDRDPAHCWFRSEVLQLCLAAYP
jgi:DNA-binding transcriptional LysR family regulator